MQRLFYTLLFTLALPIIVVRLWLRGSKLPAYRARIGERFGVIPQLEKKHKQTIWFHTVSVGEFIAASQLINALLETNQYDIVVTTTTPTGSEQVSKKFGARVYHVYAPYDIPFLINRFLNKTAPSLAVFMETELWPNTLRQCHKHAIPTLLANGRLSAKSAKGYAKFSNLTKPMLHNLSFAAIQNPTDAERFYRLGLAQKSSEVTGSIKFDIAVDATLAERAAQLKGEYSLEGKRKILIAASTHRGEDEIILDGFHKLLERNSSLLLLLVPRHPDRFNSVAQLCTTRGFNIVTRSSQQAPSAQTHIVLGDTMGELMLMYGAADIAFVGGSFVANGGHNYLEPAVWGLPIVSGPSQFNFATIAQALTRAASLYTVHSADELADQVDGLFANSVIAQQAGLAGKRFVSENQGATQKHLDIIQRLLANGR